jgi:prepilin-type N-terminal cleavage/methylation domain-containing protein
MRNQVKSSKGFSMIELLVATAIFMVLAGAVFSVLFSSQVRYQSESSLTTAFQQANIVVDQMVRDIHSTGYPPASVFNVAAYQGQPAPYAVAFPWSPNYPYTTCTLGVCTTPSDYDLVLETTQENGTGIQWIRYSLQGTTLLRGATAKITGQDPLSYLPLSAMTTYLENVQNQNNSLAMFQYYDASGTLLQTGAQLSQIHQVNIYLQVRSSRPDQQTRQYRTIIVTGQAVAFNANQ